MTLNFDSDEEEYFKNKPKTKCKICNKEILLCSLNFHNNSHSSQILPWLFLGSEQNALDINELNYHKISFILNCGIECENTSHNNKYSYLKLDIKDLADFDIKIFFKEAHDFINKAKFNSKNILIHCFAGLSRSPSIVISYLMKELKYSYFDAYNFVKEKRPQIKINIDFLIILKQYENELNEERKFI